MAGCSFPPYNWAALRQYRKSMYFGTPAGMSSAMTRGTAIHIRLEQSLKAVGVTASDAESSESVEPEPDSI